MEKYTLPAQTRIGHVHLKVADLQRSMDFYCGLLGFELMVRYGEDAAFISAGGYHHHIGLNTWYSKGQPPAPGKLTGDALLSNVHVSGQQSKDGPSAKMPVASSAPGLFHTAILYPERRDLAAILSRLMDHGYPLTGASDHGVSEALYLEDPDGNGVELYWDRPRTQWPLDESGKLTMFTHRLDIPSLLRELETT